MKVLAVVLFIALQTVTLAAAKSRIVGGQAARGGQFPFIAAIYVSKNSGTYFCGGSIISNQWILTAAQCVDGATSFTIQLGSNTLTGTDQNRVTLATSTYVTHPDYNSTSLQNDIALIKLRMPIEFNVYVGAISLPSSFTPDHEIVSAIGWGQVDDFNTGLSESLLWVSLTTLSIDECQMTYGEQITYDMVCVAGNLKEGICHGDMGGPLVQTIGGVFVHVGIAIFTSNNGCETTDPSGYTRTIPYVDWIRNVTQN